MKGSFWLLVTFIVFMALIASCLSVLIIVFQERTVANFVNCFLLLGLIIVGASLRGRPGWYGLLLGTGLNALCFFASYCLRVHSAVNYLYALGFALCMFALGTFVRPGVQEAYGLGQAGERPGEEGFPRIKRDEILI